VQIVCGRAIVYIGTVAYTVIGIAGAVAVVVIDEDELIEIVIGINVRISIINFTAFAIADLVVDGVKEGDVHVIDIVGQLS